MSLNASLQPVWSTVVFSTLNAGQYVNGLNYDGVTNTTWDIDATPNNTGNKIVARDANGDFIANNITATLLGESSQTRQVYLEETGTGGGFFGSGDPNDDFNIVFQGSATSGDRFSSLQVDNGGLTFNPATNTISGSNVILDGRATDNVDKSGDTMTGFLTLHADPTSNLHAATKQYVDSLTSAATNLWAGVTTLANVQATYAGFAVGTRVAFWQERTYSRSANSNGGSVSITDRFRRVVQKAPNGSWVDVG